MFINKRYLENQERRHKIGHNIQHEPHYLKQETQTTLDTKRRTKTNKPKNNNTKS